MPEVLAVLKRPMLEKMAESFQVVWYSDARAINAVDKDKARLKGVIEIQPTDRGKPLHELRKIYRLHILTLIKTTR